MSNTIPMPVTADRRAYDLFARASTPLPEVPAPRVALSWLAAARHMLSDVGTAWRAHRQRIATRRALLGLDDRTLRDIGIVRAEVESLAAEAHGGVAATRARMLKHVLPLN